MSESLGTAIYTFRADDSQLMATMRALPGLINAQGRSAEQTAAKAFGQVGGAAGRSFTLGVGGSIGGIAQSIGDVGTRSGAQFAAGIAAGTKGLSSSIAAPLGSLPASFQSAGASSGQSFGQGARASFSTVMSDLKTIAAAANIVPSGDLRFKETWVNAISGVAGAFKVAGASAGTDFGNSVRSGVAGLPDAIGTIGTSAGRSFSGGVMTGSAGLALLMTNPLGSVQSSFTSAGGSAGRSFAAAVASGLGSISVAARSAASRMSAPFISAGRRMGENLRGDIQRRIGYGVSNQIIGGATRVAGSLVDTKNMGESDREARHVATVVGANQQAAFLAEAKRLSKELKYALSSKEIQEGQYQAGSAGFTDLKEVTAIVKGAAKVKIVGGESVKMGDAVTAITRLYESVKKSGLDGKGGQNLKLDEMLANKLASMISGLADASVGIEEGVISRQIGKLVQPGTRSNVDPYEALGLSSKATTKMSYGPTVAGYGQVIKGIEAPSKQALIAAQEIGLDLSSTALITKGLFGFFEDYNKKIKEYTKANGLGEANTLQAKIFKGAQASNYVSAVIDDIPGAKKRTEIIRNASVDTKASVVQAGMIAQQEAFKRSLIELDLQIKSGLIGTLLTDSFRAATIAIGGLASGVEKLGNWYNNLNEPSQTAIRVIGGVGIAATAAAIGLTGLGIVMGIVGAGFTAGAAALTPFIPIVLGVGAALGALYLIYQNFKPQIDAFAAGVVDAFNRTATAAQPWIESIGQSLGTFIEWYSKVAIEGWKFTGSVISGLAKIVVAAAQWIADIGIPFAGILEWYAKIRFAGLLLAGSVIGLFSGTVLAAAQWIADISKPFVELIGWYTKLQAAGWKFSATLVSAWAGMWGEVWQGVISFGTNAIGKIGSICTKIGGLFNAAGTEVSRVWSEMWSGVSNATSGATKSVSSGISNFGGKTIALFGNVASSVVGSIDKWLQSMGLLPKGMSIVDVAIKAFKATAVGQFASALLSVVKFKDGSIGAFDAVIEKIKSMMGWLTDLPNKIQNATSIITGGQPSSGGTGASIVATGYTPGEGNTKMEGGKIDYLKRKLTKDDPVIATRTTGAINGIPDGAQVEITDPKTNKKTTATVRDRGPLQPGVDVDLTTQVFKNLGIEVDAKGMPKQGKIDLQIKVLSVPGGKVADKYDLGTSGGGYYKEGKYVGNYGREISSGSGGGFLEGIGKAISGGVSSMLANTPLKDIINPKNLIPNLQEFRAPRKGYKHEGIDYNAPAGTPVLAPFAGTATYSNQGKLGSQVVVKSIDGTTIARLLHMTDESARFFAGKSIDVQAGQRIGEVGTFGARYRGAKTGTGNKEHLHAEIRVKNGDSYDLQNPAKAMEILLKSQKGQVALAGLSSIPDTIEKNLPSLKEQKSTPQAPTPKAKSKPKPKAILNPRTNPEATGLEPSDQRAIDKQTTGYLRAEQRLAQLREKGAKIELIAKAEERVDDLKLKLDQTVSKAKKRRPSAPIINQNTPAPEGVDPAAQKQINSTETAIKRKEKELERLISSDAKEERISKVQEQIADKKDKLAELKIKAKKRKPSSRSPILAIDKAAPEGVDQAVQDQINATETRIKREEVELKQLIESGAKSDRITKLKEKISDDQGKLKKLKQKRKVPKVLPTVTAEIDSTGNPDPAQPSTKSGALEEALEKERRALQDIEDIEYDGVKKSESAYRDKLKRAQRRYADARKLVEKIKGKSSDPKVQAEIDLTKIKSEIDPILSKTSLLNLSTDQAVARDPKLAAVGEKTKAARLVGQSQALAKFLPEIARLRAKYQDNPETIIKIDAIEATIRSSDKDATSATSAVGKAATAKRLEAVKEGVEKITRDRDRAIEAARNNALRDPSVTKENLDQAILSLQIKYNAELQKQIPLIKAAKAAASDRSDIKAYEDLADAIARTNAETISANRGDSFATIKSSIDKQVTSSTTRSEEIATNGQSRIAGEVDIAKIQQIQLETQQRQVANQELYNAEIQKTKEQLDYLRSIAKGDEIAPIEEYQRKISKIDADTKTAASEYLKADTQNQLDVIKKQITNITRVGDKRQSIVKDNAILNPPAEVKNSFLDSNVAIEKQNAEALLSIRQQTTKELLAQIPILEALRALQGNDPAATERINEELAGIRAYQVETINATRAKKEADLAASVVGQTTRQLNVEMGSSFKAMFLDIENGGRNINSIFDNLLNKIANIGLSGIFDSLFGNIGGGGKSGGILDGLGGIVGSIFGFKDGGAISDAPPIPNFKTGGGIGAAFGLAASVSEAFRKEGAGSKGRLIVANTDERILNPQQTSIFNGMLSDGTWQQFEKMYVGNHSNGGMVGAVNQSTQVRSNPVSSDRSGGRQGVVVDRINSVDYVSLDQLQAYVSVQMPVAVRAAEAKSTANLSNSAYRQQNGIR